MFFTLGGTYARDNFPGLAMMDPATGLLFIAGIIALARNPNRSWARLLICLLVLNFIPGIFSISQEGPPYVYRTAAVMIPAFLIAGFGVRWLLAGLERRLPANNVNLLAGAVLLLTIALNLYFYFGLEPRNAAAMRVMAHETRLLGLEIARDKLPVVLAGRMVRDHKNAVTLVERYDLPLLLAGPDILVQNEILPRPEEKYWRANPPLVLSHALAKLAVINFSGRFDLAKTVSRNFMQPQDMFFVELASLRTGPIPVPGPAKIIFRSQERELWEELRRTYPDAAVRVLYNIYGEPELTVLTLARKTAVSLAPHDVK
jgi:hypothetical protein